jgi:hypothetical protein
VYDSYKVKFPGGVNINIISDVYFDDKLNQMQDISQEAAGNLLLCVDIGKPGPKGGSIYWAHVVANRRTTTTAQIEQLAKLDPTFRCTLETISVEQTLISNEGTVIVECPLGSAWIENIQLAAPLTTGKSANPFTNNLY